jgi:WD40 repeat protein
VTPAVVSRPAWGTSTRLPLGHVGDYGTRLAVSPYGRVLATLPRGQVQVWDLDTAQAISTFDVDSAQPITAVAFQPGNAILAIGTQRTTSTHPEESVTLWNIATGSKVATIGSSYWVSALAFSPDGSAIAIGHWAGDRTIQLWNVATSTLLWTSKEAGYAINDLAFSPDGTILASAGQSHEVQFWDTKTGDEVKSLIQHGIPVQSVRFASDGMRAASIAGRQIRVWNTANREMLSVATASTDGVLRGWWTVTADLAMYALVTTTNEVALMDTATGGVRRSWPFGRTHLEHAAITPDGQIMAAVIDAGDENAMLVLWLVESTVAPVP